MSLSPVSSDSSQSLGSLLLQQLNAASSGTTQGQDTSGLTGALGDLLTLSPTAQQLTQAPSAVTQALSDLLSGQKDVSGDLSQLKAFFQKHPQSLASVLGSLQANATYGAPGGQTSTAALLTSLMNHQSNNSNPASLLALLNGNTTQDSLFSLLGDSGSGSDGSAVSLLG
ncbi:hypothetical protein GETHLI_15360 [Geothrix limicola]|uniref:Uncharacterized protein n=1 Tax=Geothrix limicola TaxID=2927978 RepID=A0ABQ5QG59_9BACT|nr:hypothetical protein [Geothrix limicola]GLH73034.1 hypothetical protein GETHLI_15360 [Geothrix limicola]